MAEKQFQKNDVIFQQGDTGDSFYQVIDGAVGIFVSYDGGEESKLCEIHKGEFFGEMAVIDVCPRSGSAVALEDGTTVKEIATEELNAYFEKEPESIGLLMKTLSKRLRDLTVLYDEAKETAQKLGGDAHSTDEAMGRTLRRLKYFYKVRKSAPSAEIVREEKNHSEGFAKNVVTYPKGTVICQEGDSVQCMYDIHWGRVGIFKNYGKPEEVQLAILGVNEFFGEMGMVDNAPRSATAVALDDETTVEIIYPDDFAELFEKNPLKVDMILKHISFRLRSLTSQYYDVCEKISQE